MFHTKPLGACETCGADEQTECEHIRWRVGVEKADEEIEMNPLERIKKWLKPVAAREITPVPPWITIERYKGAADGYWKAIDLIYYDPGNTVVYAYAEDAAGKPSLVSKAMQTNGGLTLLPFELKEGRAEATFGMTGDSSFDPKRGEVGPYSLAMFGASDKVHGIGLPLKQHVELHVTFRWTLNAPPPPPPPSDNNHYVTEMELPNLVKQIVLDQWGKP